MIAVKKSEFIEEYERNARSMAGAEAAAKAVEMAGMEWLPEEPDLPERLTTVPFGATRQLATEEDRRILTADEYDEAAARWNAAERAILSLDEPYLEDVLPVRSVVENFRRILRQEREKLQ